MIAVNDFLPLVVPQTSLMRAIQAIVFSMLLYFVPS